MGVINRGVKNAFRNVTRTISVIFILAISIAMVLVMYMSLKTVEGKIASVKSSIGNTITISPAGIRGFEGGGELLSETNISKIAEIPGVAKTVKTLTDHLMGTTSLQSAIEAGSFGRRQQDGSRGASSNQAPPSSQHDFKMPIMITGTNDLSDTTNLNVSSFEVKGGDKFDGSSAENVAMIGSGLADKNSLSAGSTFTAYDTNIKVVGVFDGGNNFANNLVVMPIKALQNLSDQKDQVNSVLVQVSSIDKIDSVVAGLKTTFGTTADIVSSQDTSKQAVEPLENIRNISLYSLIGALVAGGVILFLTMIMIVRERRREIGVLKAIGSSNFLVSTQFAVESLVLTLMASVIGMVAGTLLSNPILKMMVSGNTSAGPANAGQEHMQMMRVGAGVVNGAQGALRDLQAVVGWEVILYGMLAAVIIAIIGSVLPSFIIAKVRPAEVLRSE